MKLQCAILDDYQGVALSMADWSSIEDTISVTAFQQHFADEDALVAAVSQCDIVVVMRERTPFHGALFERLPNLKLLVTTGMRNASIDLDAAKRHGVVVCGTESHSRAPAELTWALILGLAKNLVKENMELRRNGPWQSTVSTDLRGKTLGVLGLGRIGMQVAQIGLAFGMQVVAWSQNLTEDRANAAGARLAASKEALLREADFVTIHLVLSDRTRGLIGRRDLQLMRSTAYLINTSRSGIVDQAALQDALRRGLIAGAGLDVFDVEPLPSDHPYRSLPNVLATPHIGYVSQDTYQAWFTQVVEDIEAYLNGSPVRLLS
ncbi:D-2-hydroxyacid dehydrogenase family protein [Alicyclobacillus cycloheptanicus]|uniref:Phosphoglycerate dehydrogenase-like enzyme n=1 Tax=Alicyclobacillus cycloheptanicus TaxID=1457 RepID=A0ABT9XH47_9BACL|nr:D-2-hydroxyacid dehydrogenase family protein [Alicyclobacillus cycloheptanicus]MDQ0189061.1 phosphoglycerate dehydrogenase-like enzyme [Alicyclobacillus cycloheptanicus]WDM00197.1 D-2-hydroxyacid dehydrogenase family protein [Alicyclobacillus cycloheptanicus]